jgi:hypothetical protein
MVFSTGAGVDLQNKRAMGKVGRSAIRIAKSHILGRSGEPVILPADEEVAPYTSSNFDRMLPNSRYRIVNCLGFFNLGDHPIGKQRPGHAHSKSLSARH